VRVPGNISPGIIIYVLATNATKSWIYRGDDGGASWSLRPIGPFPSTKFDVSPWNPDLVLVNAADGIYRSADGGRT
jgi:hypothetical protein